MLSQGLINIFDNTIINFGFKDFFFNTFFNASIMDYILEERMKIIIAIVLVLAIVLVASRIFSSIKSTEGEKPKAEKKSKKQKPEKVKKKKRSKKSKKKDEINARKVHSLGQETGQNMQTMQNPQQMQNRQEVNNQQQMQNQNQQQMQMQMQNQISQTNAQMQKNEQSVGRVASPEPMQDTQSMQKRHYQPNLTNSNQGMIIDEIIQQIKIDLKIDDAKEEHLQKEKDLRFDKIRSDLNARTIYLEQETKKVEERRKREALEKEQIGNGQVQVEQKNVVAEPKIETLDVKISEEGKDPLNDYLTGQTKEQMPSEEQKIQEEIIQDEIIQDEIIQDELVDKDADYLIDPSADKVKEASSESDEDPFDPYSDDQFDLDKILGGLDSSLSESQKENTLSDDLNVFSENNTLAPADENSRDLADDFKDAEKAQEHKNVDNLANEQYNILDENNDKSRELESSVITTSAKETEVDSLLDKLENLNVDRAVNVPSPETTNVRKIAPRAIKEKEEQAINLEYQTELDSFSVSKNNEEVKSKRPVMTTGTDIMSLSSDFSLLMGLFNDGNTSFEDKLVSIDDFLATNKNDRDLKITIISEDTILMNNTASKRVYEHAVSLLDSGNIIDAANLLKQVSTSSIDPTISNDAYNRIESILLGAGLEGELENLISTMIDKEKQLINLIRSMKAGYLEENRSEGSYV